MERTDTENEFSFQEDVDARDPGTKLRQRDLETRHESEIDEIKSRWKRLKVSVLEGGFRSLNVVDCEGEGEVEPCAVDKQEDKHNNQHNNLLTNEWKKLKRDISTCSLESACRNFSITAGEKLIKDNSASSFGSSSSNSSTTGSEQNDSNESLDERRLKHSSIINMAIKATKKANDDVIATKIRKRKIAVTEDHSGILHHLREELKIPRRKLCIKDDHNTVLRNLDYPNETCRSRKYNNLSAQSRRVGAKVDNCDHYDILLKMDEDGTSKKVKEDIEEATYELEAKRICQQRRGALAWYKQ